MSGGTQRGDFSRLPSGRERRYSGVWMQQGRVQLDADWNEQAALVAHRLTTGAIDVIGPSGAPAGDAGYEVSARSALRFDGKNQYVVAGASGSPSLADAAGLTLEAYLTVRAGGPGGTVASRWLRRPGEEGFRLAWVLSVEPDGSLRCERPGLAEGELRSPTGVAFGQPVHVALTYDGASTVLYVNGEVAASDLSSPQLTSHPASFLLGATLRDNLPHRCLDGLMYEVRVWARARTQEEIRSTLRRALSGEEEGLVGDWRFDEGAGVVVADRSPSQHQALLGGGVEAHRPRWLLRSLLIGPGRFYVDGLLCQNESTVAFTAQPDYPEATLPQPAGKSGLYLFYLDVWERSISCLEDPTLREVALGGPDTATRTAVVAQVKCMAVSGHADRPPATADYPEWHHLLAGAARRGRLRARRRPASVTLGNLLYRVEIHSAGGRWGWPRPETSRHAPVEAERVSGREIELKRWGDDLHAWRPGDAVELASDVTDLAQEAGSLAVITAVDSGKRTIGVDRDLTELASHTHLRLRRVLTFKWSRNNAAVAFAVAEHESGNRVLRLVDSGAGPELAAGDHVELVDDRAALQGRPGFLAEIESIDPLSLTVTLAQAPPTGLAADPALHPVLRRWEGAGAGSSGLPVEPGRWVPLEAGIEVFFEGEGALDPGDYWVMAARTLTEDVDWPRDDAGRPHALPPWGIDHHWAPLAELRYDDEGFRVTDLRATFQPISTGAVSKAGDVMTGPLDIRSDLTVAGDARVGTLYGQLGDSGIVHRRHLAEGAVGPSKLSPAVGVVPPGASILGDSPQPPVGFTATGSVLTLFNDAPPWQARLDLPVDPPGPLASAEVGGRVYTFLESGAVWEYDPASGRARARRDMPLPRRAFGVAAAGGRIYVAGGLDAIDRPIRSTLEYDPGSDTWTSRGDMPTARGWLGLAAVDGKLYAGGGLRSSLFGLRATAVHEVYDPETDRWRRRRALPRARYAFGAAGCGGKVHVLGGERRLFFGLWGKSLSRQHREYHPASDRWLPRATSMTTPRRSMGVAVVFGRLWAVGGEAPFGHTPECEAYDPATESWSALPELPEAVAGPGVAAVGGTVVTTGAARAGASGVARIWESAAAGRFYIHRRDLLEEPEEEAPPMPPPRAPAEGPWEPDWP